MEIYIIARITTFVILVIMALIDWKTKHVPFGFPILPAICGVMSITSLISLGYSIDIWWAGTLLAIFFYNFYMMRIGYWKFADAVTISSATTTLFTAEVIVFSVICYSALIALSIYAKQKKKSLEIPFMPIMPVAYLLAVLIL